VIEVDSCPEANELRDLLLGLTSDPVGERIERHVSTCAECAVRMQRLQADDDLVQACRASRETPPDPHPDLLSGLIPRLKRLSGSAETITQLPAMPSATKNELPDETEATTAETARGRLGPFEIRQILGKGGMGIVYHAHDTRLDRDVALKVIHPRMASRVGMLERFRSEAKAAAAVEHDHIVGVFEIEEANGVPYLAMPLLRGESLEARLKKNAEPLPIADILQIGRQTALGLAAAHHRGLVHRDIKPSNLWLQETGSPIGGDAASSFQVKILDFGLAQPVTTESGGEVMGTPAFMSPEQAIGKKIDARSDLFSLGCVLYELATGRSAFRGESTRELLLSVMVDHPKAVAELNPKLPTKLVNLINRLLAKKPEDRPNSAADVVREIEEIERSLQPRTWRRWFGPVAALFVTVIGLIAFFTWRANPPSTGEAIFELPAMKEDMIVISADGREFRIPPQSTRRFVFPASVYTARFADGTKRRPWPEQFTIQPSKLTTVKIQEIGQEGRYAGHTGGVNAVVFVSGKSLINASAAGGDFKLVVWNPESNEKPVLLAGHGAQPLCLAVSPDGAFLASGEGGKTKTERFETRIWKLSTGETIAKHDDFDDWITAVAFTQDGKHLLTGLRDGTLVMRNLGDNKSLALPGHQGRILNIAMLPKQRMVTIGADRRAIVWDLEKKTIVKDLKLPVESHAGACSPDGATLATADDDGLVRLWSIESGEVAELAGHKGPVHAVAFSLDGTKLLTGGADRSLRLWDLMSGTEILKETHDGEVRAAAFSADGKHALSGSLDRTVRLWKLPE